MRPTRIPVLLAVAVVAGVAAWFAAGRSYDAVPPLPSYAPASLALLGIAELYWASVVRARVQHRRPGRPLHPISIARAAALAKASALVGALATGGYAGFLVYAVGDLTTQARTHDAQVSGAGVGTALLLAVAALVLERACRVPGDGDDHDQGHDHEPPG